jgi:hypothetical protein
MRSNNTADFFYGKWVFLDSSYVKDGVLNYQMCTWSSSSSSSYVVVLFFDYHYDVVLVGDIGYTAQSVSLVILELINRCYC